MDPRVTVLRNDHNMGVGGATLVGMQQAAEDKWDIIVKIDGDGQMDPAMIPAFVGLIIAGDADYTKGNRFFEPEGVASMPLGRLVGNAGLSFMAKASTGYWHSFDPNNGYIAIHAALIDLLPVDKIAKRYFFESDMLFRLNLIGARVVDIPMHSHYADEVSNMNPYREMPRFAISHLKNMWKRVFYTYFLRNFSIASLELIFGLILGIFGVLYGALNWNNVTPATAGTVMAAALPIIVGSQLFLAFLNFDIQSVPRSTLHRRLATSSSLIKPLKHSSI